MKKLESFKGKELIETMKKIEKRAKETKQPVYATYVNGHSGLEVGREIRRRLKQLGFRKVPRIGPGFSKKISKTLGRI